MSGRGHAATALAFWRRYTWQLCAGLAAVALAAVVWFSMDHSRELTAREVAALREWVQGTQSPAVARLFNELQADGTLTVYESGLLAEEAKAAPVPAGLYQPVQMD
ncbi:hypothetical protein LJR168_003806 [Pseudoxanthomonas sp. LjRoot168]|uniref:hypothetical protein n=1 Tax=unclassified Pseudoxanthomonas TaxID=2645906 RepID=UPI003ECF2CAE